VFFVLLSLNVLKASVSYAQKSKNENFGAIIEQNKKLYSSKINQQFYPLHTWGCLGGDSLNIGRVKKPAILLLGFSGCAPCRTAIPVLNSLATKEKYAGYTFAYMTFNTKEQIAQEFDELNVPIISHIKIVSVPQEYITNNKIATGYPVIYFIRSNKTVSAIHTHGLLDGPIESEQYWESIIDTLQ
jgi:thiol-disulfide isomerase/thioredoxin